MLPWLPFSLKTLNSEHFYGTVQLISHFMVSPWMAADAISGLPFYLNWKCFSDFPNVLNSSLAKAIYRQRWSNAHVTAAPGWFNGYVCHFPFTLSFKSRPDALRTWPCPLPEQRSLPILCGCEAWTGSCVPAGPHARAGLCHPVGWQSTWRCHPGPHQLQQVLLCLDRKRSLFQRSGALSFSQNIHEGPFEGLSNFWESGSKVLKVDTNWCKEMLLLSLYSNFSDVHRGFSFQKVLK